MSADREHGARWTEGLGLSALLGLAALVLAATQWLWRWDRLAYDLTLQLGARPAPQDVLLVAIDERSLAELGRWPWPRRLHAQLLDAVTRGGARVIGMDLVFAEEAADDPEGDAALARAVGESARVVLPVLPEQLGAGGQLVETLPLPALTAATAGLGHVDLELDLDGMARSVYLRAGLGSAHWPHFAVAMLEVANPGGRQDLAGQRRESRGPASPFLWVRDHRVGIPFSGPPGHFLQVSYADVLGGRVPPDTFADRLVLVGMTASGLGAGVPTPVSGLAQPMAGVEVMANVLDGLRGGRMITSLAPGGQMVLSVLLALLPGLLYPRLVSRYTLPAAGLLLILPVAISLALLLGRGVWFGPMPALLALGASLPLWSWRGLARLARSLAEQRSRAEVTLRSVEDGVITSDGEGVVRYLNPAAEAFTGWPVREATGQPLEAVFHAVDEDSRVPLRCLPETCVGPSAVAPPPRYVRLLSRNGGEYSIRLTVSAVEGGNGGGGLVITFSDVTAERRLSAQIAHQANHDALTDLPNRTLLQDRLRQAILRGQRSGRAIAVLFADLDDFKKINDSLGHSAGDDLLRAAATRLWAGVREQDTVARLGGDEFVVVVEDLSHEEVASAVAGKLIDAVRPPFVVEGHEVFVTLTVGISLFPKDGRDLDTLLRNADTALYRAKDLGRDSFQFYRPEMNLYALEALRLENDLRRALTHGDLDLLYQPIVDLRANRMTGAEALLRWRHPQRGVLPPAEFIRLAEATGLILPIGEWALRAACADRVAWRKGGDPDLRVAVNLSPRQFLQPNLVDLVSTTLGETGLDASWLELEITEDVLMTDAAAAMDTLQALAGMGVHLAIDDFGTGYSSLSYLKRLPVDRLKIDRSFVRDVTADPDDAAIVRAVIALAHNLSLGVTAEGVETAPQAQFLYTHGCHELQGYLFSHPVSAQELGRMLHDGRVWLRRKA